ncbi:hypothetical protein AAOE16_08375 [Ekhidna sp. MALMAid0563]|uniref:hypothetical protein n=1 Tax=Ekhidna sp. MALMAid0563 TaxID=3143937 RepID=UPI0032DE9000
MKKHHLILLSLLLCSLFWGYCAATFTDSELTGKMMLGLMYLTILSLLIPIVFYNKQLSTKGKIGWVLFGLILTPVLPLIYYFKYRDEIQRIIDDRNRKMKEGPKSLNEFDSRSN